MSPDERLLKLMNQMNFDAIVPIPQNTKRTLERGHSSSLEVARFFSRLMGIPIEKEWLKLKPDSNRKQALLNEWERRYLDNPFEIGTISSTVYNKTYRVLIVDDFVTSGSTLNKAANEISASIKNLEIYAGCLGWKPKIVLQRQERHPPIESDRESRRSQTIADQSSLAQFQIVSQFAQEHE